MLVQRTNPRICLCIGSSVSVRACLFVCVLFGFGIEERERERVSEWIASLMLFHFLLVCGPNILVGIAALTPHNATLFTLLLPLFSNYLQVRRLYCHVGAFYAKVEPNLSHLSIVNVA